MESQTCLVRLPQKDPTKTAGSWEFIADEGAGARAVFFWGLAKVAIFHQENFSQIWLQAKYLSNCFCTSFCISGYLLVPCVDILVIFITLF
jgi:hypothetical protein